MTQLAYAEILLIDCGFNNTQRRAYLDRVYGTPDLDALTKGQLSLLINTLKERKTYERDRKETSDEE